MTPEGGFLLLWRKYFDHPYWAEKRVYSRAEAWLDCWGNMAAYDPYVKIMAGIRIPLERGQFIASERFLEKRWGWSRGKVRRFLAKCLNDGELVRVTPMNGVCSVNEPDGGTIYSVVKYDVYQPRSTNDSTNDGPPVVPTTDQRETSKTNKTSKASGAKAPREPKRGAQLPEDWKPGEGHVRLAKERNVNLLFEVEQFRDHAKANGRVQKDWDAAFRTWLRRAFPRTPKAPAGSEASRFPNGRTEQRHYQAHTDAAAKREGEQYVSEADRVKAWIHENRDEAKRLYDEIVAGLGEAGSPGAAHRIAMHTLHQRVARDKLSPVRLVG
jgi:hypothetical protein